MYDSVAKSYSEPADIKKVDAGGGMIHGNAEDFKADISKRVILSHMSHDLSWDQKQIGSAVQFGTVDILIPASEDYLRAHAFRYLQSYSPNFSPNQIKLLTNCPIRSFSPQTIIYKAGEMAESVFMIVSGEVEFVDPVSGDSGSISPGMFMGHISAIRQTPVIESFTAVTFVRALELPLNIFRYFADIVDLKKEQEPLYEKRKFLKKTQLFMGSISMPVLNQIVSAIGETRANAGEEIHIDSAPDIFIVMEGKLNLCLDSQMIETLQPGDFFCEQGVLFKMKNLFRPQVVEDSLLFRIPGDLLLNIPAVRWKLLETHNIRMQFLLNPDLSTSSIFEWRDEYRTNIQSLDDDHRKLFASADALYRRLSLKEDVDLDGLFSFLANYAERHFNDEEILMGRYFFPGLERHQVEHRQFFRDIAEVRNRFRTSPARSGMECIKFLRDWVIRHILTTDRQYGTFLNEKGVF